MAIAEAGSDTVDSCVKHDWSLDCQQLAYASSVSRQRLDRVFDAFRRREANSLITYADQRGAVRHDYNEPIVLALSPGEYEGFEIPVQLAVNAWTINISKSGLGVVCGRKLYPINQIDEEIPLFSTQQIFDLDCELRVVFLRDGYEVKGLLAKIVRLDDACEELLDVGIEFYDRETVTHCPCRSLKPFVDWLQPYATYDFQGA